MERKQSWCTIFLSLSHRMSFYTRYTHSLTRSHAYKSKIKIYIFRNASLDATTHTISKFFFLLFVWVCACVRVYACVYAFRLTFVLCILFTNLIQTNTKNSWSPLRKRERAWACSLSHLSCCFVSNPFCRNVLMDFLVYVCALYFCFTSILPIPCMRVSLSLTHSLCLFSCMCVSFHYILFEYAWNGEGVWMYTQNHDFEHAYKLRSAPLHTIPIRSVGQTNTCIQATIKPISNSLKNVLNFAYFTTCTHKSAHLSYYTTIVYTI